MAAKRDAIIEIALGYYIKGDSLTKALNKAQEEYKKAHAKSRTMSKRGS